MNRRISQKHAAWSNICMHGGFLGRKECEAGTAGEFEISDRGSRWNLGWRFLSARLLEVVS